MGFCTTRLAGRIVITLVTAMVLFGTTPATALPNETSPQMASVQDELERLAGAIEEHSDRAIAAAAQAARRTIEDNKDALSDLESEWAAQVESFRALLNDQKANFDKIGEDVAAAFDAWMQESKESWKKSWQEAWTEMHHSALEALDRLQALLERNSASNEPIPV